MKNATIAILAKKIHLAALFVADESAPQHMKVLRTHRPHRVGFSRLPRTEAEIYVCPIGYLPPCSAHLDLNLHAAILAKKIHPAALSVADESAPQHMKVLRTHRPHRVGFSRLPRIEAGIYPPPNPAEHRP